MRKSVTAIAIAAIVITYTAAHAAHIVGNTEPTAVSAEGGE
ncbi:hypothetical protein CFELI_08255 [Corynebacterium felinum]|uniref:Uncharacterized protein n=1 Tax=Corynebacterium felinum TaxID=131318 RepID=A0ABU2BCB3_9CORY|nr:hypothetical protein [Corynebacterium felinum]WJY95257.1 hypothetical protein CFELI_08255 [Corynebacterium felinum]